jgi:hypothetical protein
MTLKHLSAFAFIFLTLGACGSDPIKSLDRSADCADICQKYKECIATDYDVSDCSDRCSDMNDDQQTARIDDCETCLDDKSCVNSVFSCTAECAGIVP